VPHSHRTSPFPTARPAQPGTTGGRAAADGPEDVGRGTDNGAATFRQRVVGRGFVKWGRLVVQSLLVGLLVSGGVAVSWQTDVTAPSPPADTPLFTPGPGSVGAAASLEAPRRGWDIGDSVRRGWNDGGLLDLESVPRPANGGAGGPLTAAAFAGTEFEEFDAAGSRASVAGGGGGGGTDLRAPAGGQSAADRSGSAAPAGNGVTPQRWAARGDSAARAPAANADSVATTIPAPDADCGWLGLACASRGLWMASGGLAAAGVALVGMILREVYGVR